MSGKEISIVEYELSDCNGNLRTLRGSWESMPSITEQLGESRGEAADEARDCVDAAAQVRAAMQTLLTDTISFFERTGITFRDADDEAAANADTLTL